MKLTIIVNNKYASRREGFWGQNRILLSDIIQAQINKIIACNGRRLKPIDMEFLVPT